MKKHYEDMTTEELIIEMRELHKKLGYNPEELKIDSEGVIILDRENEADRYWIKQLGEE